MASALKKYDRQFKKIYRLSLFLSLFLLTILFYLFPRFPKPLPPQPDPIQIKIYISDVPQTHQTRPAAAPPARPYGMIPVPGEEPDFPAEIMFSTPGSPDSGVQLATGVPPETPARPIMEVYPTVSGVTCKGFVRVLLLVSKTGVAESVEVLENTTGADTCLSLVIEAAQKSRWIPASVENQAVSSWVTKTYTFNPKD